jgi:hypothetical protein
VNVAARIAATCVSCLLCVRAARAQTADDVPDAGADGGAPIPAEAPAPPPAVLAPPPALPPGPAIELPPETPAPSRPSVSLRSAAADSDGDRPMTIIGGYGQLDLKYRRLGFGNDFDGRANVRRIVLLVDHAWSERIHSYVELEWENAVTCGAACQGIAEVEQAFIDAALIGPALHARVGLMLVPMGIINRWHEPPVFFGVDRPGFDQSVIPTTWRELGAGLAGRVAERWRWEAYVMTAVDPTRLGPDGFIGGRGLGMLQPARAAAVVGRVEYSPWLGTIIGLAGYASDMAPNAQFFDAAGQRIYPRFPLLGWAADVRARRAGFELRLVAAQFFMPRSGALMDTRRADGSFYYPDPAVTGPVPNRTQGGYVELAYDVLRVLIPRTAQQLLPFVRAESYNTQAAVPDFYQPRGEFDVNELTFGLSYLPMPQVVGKADVQLRDRRYGLDELLINFGVGWMF